MLLAISTIAGLSKLLAVSTLGTLFAVMSTALFAAAVSVPAGPVILLVAIFLFIVIPNDGRNKAGYASAVLAGLIGIVFLALGFLAGGHGSASAANAAIAIVTYVVPIIAVLAVILGFNLLRKFKTKDSNKNNGSTKPADSTKTGDAGQTNDGTKPNVPPQCKKCCGGCCRKNKDQSKDRK